MRVFFSPRARRRAGSVAAWWKQNRPSAPSLFDEELSRAMELLAVAPKSGAIYRTQDSDVVHRVLLPKTEQHVYYVVDEAAGVVMLLTIWGARRGRGPRL